MYIQNILYIQYIRIYFDRMRRKHGGAKMATQQWIPMFRFKNKKL